MRLVIISPAFEAPAVVAGFDDVTVMGQAGQQCLRDARGDASMLCRIIRHGAIQNDSKCSHLSPPMWRRMS